MVTIKSASVDPPDVPNDGTSSIRIRCEVESVRIGGTGRPSVSADLTAFKRGPEEPFSHGPEGGAPDSFDGAYECRFDVPLLTDPGHHEILISAFDSDGEAAWKKAQVRVIYRRPDYRAGLADPGNQKVLARVGASEWVEGNRVEVLAEGREALARRLEMISGAKRQINLQTYTLDGEGQSGQIMQALLRKAGEGVEVNVILNPYPQLATSPLAAIRLGLQRFLSDLQTAVGKRLEREWQARWQGSDVTDTFQQILQALGRGPVGINLLIFNADSLRRASPSDTGIRGESRPPPVWLQKVIAARTAQKQPRAIDGLELPEWLTSFQGPGGLPALPLLDYAIHEKILVVDGERAIVGGRNLDDRYFTGWIDLDLYLEGPIVGQVQRGFLRSFAEFSSADPSHPQPTALLPSLPARGALLAQFVQSRPWQGELHALETIATAMQMARRRVWATSQYLVLPDSLLRDAILDAAGRGVDVRILTNSFNTCHEVAFSAGYLISLNYFQDLVEAGVKLYEMNGTGDEDAPQPYCHVKEYLIDGELSCVGSFNLSIRSSFIESENLVNVFDPGLAATLEGLFLRRIESEATLVTPEHLNLQIQKHQTRMEIARHVELLY